MQQPTSNIQQASEFGLHIKCSLSLPTASKSFHAPILNTLPARVRNRTPAYSLLTAVRRWQLRRLWVPPPKLGLHRRYPLRVGRGVAGLVPKADPALRPALAVVELANLCVARVAVVLVAPVAAVGDARELVEPHLVGCAWEGGEESLTVLVLMCAEAAHRSRAIREREPVEDCGSTPRSGEGRGAQHCTTVAHAYYTYYCLCLLESRGHAHLTSPIGWS